MLTVLAHSFGAGMPRSLIDAVVGADAAAEVLDAARFYLRRDTDEDGTVLYRLFHQGLADHLKRQDPNGEEVLFTALLSSLGSPPRWRDAEPYLSRHAIDHAVTPAQYDSLFGDPGFLVFGASSAIGLGHALLGSGLNATGFVYQTSISKHEHLSPVRRRSVLVIDAYRLGYRAISDRFAEVAGLPALGWTPIWATTGLDALRRWRHTLHTAMPGSLVLGGHPGAPMVAVGDWTGLSVTDAGTGEVTVSSPEILGASFRCLAVGRWAGRVVVLVLSSHSAPEVWDLAAQIPLFSCTRTGRLDHAVFCEDNGIPLLVAVEASFGVVAWRLPDGRPFRRHSFHHRLEPTAVGSVGGRAVVAIARDHQLQLTPFFGKAKKYVSIDTGAPIVSLAVGEVDGHGVVLCGHQDGAVDLRSAEDLTQIRRLVPGEPDDVFGAGAPSGPLAVGERDGVPVAFTANQFGFVSCRELATGARLPGSASNLGSLTALLPGMVADRPVVVTTNGREAGIFDVDTGERVSTFVPAEPRPADFGQDGSVMAQKHHGAVRDVAVFDDIVASASTDRTVRLWDLDTGAPSHRLAGHRDWVHAVALDRVGGRLVALTGSSDCQARLWDVDSGEPLHVFTGHKGWVRAAAFVPGEERGVTAAHDGTVRVWDLDKGRCVRVFRVATQTALTSVACGPFVVAGGADDLVHVWRSAREQTFAGHEGAVWGVALSRVDGADVVLSGGEDRLVRMWRAADGTCVRTFTGFTATVTAVSTGRWQDRPILLAGSDDGTILGWDLEDGALLAEATLPGKVGAMSVSTEGKVVVGFGNDVGVICLRS